MVPNWKAAFGVNYKPIEKLNLNADLVYYGKYFDSDDPENIRAKDKGNYTTVSVSANYKFENGLALTARVNNLFNRKYEDYVGYWDNSRQYSPAAGRNYSIGIDYIFKNFFLKIRFSKINNLENLLYCIFFFAKSYKEFLTISFFNYLILRQIQKPPVEFQHFR